MLGSHERKKDRQKEGQIEERKHNGRLKSKMKITKSTETGINMTKRKKMNTINKNTETHNHSCLIFLHFRPSASPALLVLIICCSTYLPVFPA